MFCISNHLQVRQRCYEKLPPCICYPQNFKIRMNDWSQNKSIILEIHKHFYLQLPLNRKTNFCPLPPKSWANIYFSFRTAIKRALGINGTLNEIYCINTEFMNFKRAPLIFYKINIIYAGFCYTLNIIFRL